MNAKRKGTRNEHRSIQLPDCNGSGYRMEKRMTQATGMQHREYEVAVPCDHLRLA